MRRGEGERGGAKVDLISKERRKNKGRMWRTKSRKRRRKRSIERGRKKIKCRRIDCNN